MYNDNQKNLKKFELQSPFSPKGDQPQAIKKIVENFNNNQNSQTLLGVTGSGKTFTMANVIKQLNKPTLIFSHNKTLAAQLYGELKAFFPNNAVEYFISFYDYYQPEAYLPTSDIYIEKTSSINKEIDKLRLKATSSLITRNDVIIVASVSCIYGLGSPADYKSLSINLKKNQEIIRYQFFNSLIDMQYTRNKYELESGSFRVTGDTIDIHPAYEDSGIRLEMFGDEIENIVVINFLTGKVLETKKEVNIFPSKHFVVSPPKLKESLVKIENELEERIAFFKRHDKLLELQRIEQRTRMDLEFLREMGVCSGIENYSRHLGGRKEGERPYCLLDFFPKDFLLIVDESHVTLPQVRAMYKGDRARKGTLVDYGFRLPSALDNRPLKFDEFESMIHQALFVSATPSDYELEKSGGEIIEQIIRPTGIPDPKIYVRPVKDQIDDLMEEIRIVTNRNERVLVTTLTKKMSEDLAEYLNNNGVKARYLHSEIVSIDRIKLIRELRLGKYDVLVGINLLREGLDIPEVSLVAILDADREGFLRNKKSLLQSSGRAARNINSKVIFYAERMTKSMKETIEETDRRRVIQLQYNIDHNITPATIVKSATEIIKQTTLEDTRLEEKANFKENLKHKSKKGDKVKIKQDIDELRAKMMKSAEDLNFEDATIYRDEINALKKML